MVYIFEVCAVNCRNDHCYASRAQKPHFCVKTTKNLGKIAHSDTKLSILCSKGRKMGVPKPKSAQKPRFCSRRASQNSTERLSGAHRTARRSSAEHGTARRDPARQGKTSRNGTRPPGTKRNGPKHNETQPLRQRQGTATPRHNGEQQKRRQPFGLSPLKIGGYLLSHMVVQYHRRK